MAEENKFSWISFSEQLQRALIEFRAETLNDTSAVSVDYLTYYVKQKADSELIGGLKGTETTKKEAKKEGGVLSKLWGKTIFPDMIKNKKEEKAVKRGIVKEARKQALEESKPALVEHYKQQEIDKMTGKSKQDKMQKFADNFSLGGLGNTNKIEQMLGQPIQGGQQPQQPVQQQPQYQQPVQQNPMQQQSPMGGVGPSNEQLAGMMGAGGGQPQQQPQKKEKRKGVGRGWDTEEKLKNMLG